MIIKNGKRMTNLTEQQEAAMATFGKLATSNGGFHKLIIELSKEYQLPFKGSWRFKESSKTSNVKSAKIFQCRWSQFLAKKTGWVLLNRNWSNWRKITKRWWISCNSILKYQKYCQQPMKRGFNRKWRRRRDRLIEELIQAYEKIVQTFTGDAAYYNKAVLEVNAGGWDM